MARPITDIYNLEGATRLTKYSELAELIRSFANGQLQGLVLVAPPGLGKSETLLKAVEGKGAAFIRGFLTPLKLFARCYQYANKPIILDDTEAMFRSSHVREILTALTETKPNRVMEWSSSSTLLDEMGVPPKFTTSSPVTVIRNTWDSTDPLLAALASRAEFVTFIPTWAEVYSFLATWFWDQEILDYVHKRMFYLRQPDIRVVMKAWQRKVTNNSIMTWQRAIDDHSDVDPAIVHAKDLLADKRYKSDNARSKIWVETGHGHRATFFRTVNRLRAFLPLEPVKRLKAQGKARVS
jgi:hypothetical protein